MQLVSMGFGVCLNPQAFPKRRICVIVLINHIEGDSIGCKMEERRSQSHRAKRAALIVVACVAAGAAIVAIWHFSTDSIGGGANETPVETTQESISSNNSDSDSPKNAADLPRSADIDESQEGVSYISGEVIVVFEDGVTEEQETAILQGASSINLDVVPSKLGDHMFLLKLKDGVSVSQAVEQLSGLDSVRSVQPNYIYRLSD